MPARAAAIRGILHASSRADKLWPVEHWIGIGRRSGHGLRPSFMGEDERKRSELAAGLKRARTVLPLAEVARLLAGAAVVVGVTGLTHLAAALGVPVIALYCGTDPRQK